MPLLSNNFRSGIISPRLNILANPPIVRDGLRRADNVICRHTGGAQKRPCLRLVAKLDDKFSRLHQWHPRADEKLTVAYADDGEVQILSEGGRAFSLEYGDGVENVGGDLQFWSDGEVCVMTSGGEVRSIARVDSDIGLNALLMVDGDDSGSALSGDNFRRNFISGMPSAADYLASRIGLDDFVAASETARLYHKGTGFSGLAWLPSERRLAYFGGGRFGTLSAAGVYEDRGEVSGDAAWELVARFDIGAASVAGNAEISGELGEDSIISYSQAARWSASSISGDGSIASGTAKTEGGAFLRFADYQPQYSYTSGAQVDNADNVTNGGVFRLRQVGGGSIVGELTLFGSAGSSVSADFAPNYFLRLGTVEQMRAIFGNEDTLGGGDWILERVVTAPDRAVIFTSAKSGAIPSDTSGHWRVRKVGGRQLAAGVSGQVRGDYQAVSVPSGQTAFRIGGKSAMALGFGDVAINSGGGELVLEKYAEPTYNELARWNNGAAGSQDGLLRYVVGVINGFSCNNAMYYSGSNIPRAPASGQLPPIFDGTGGKDTTAFYSLRFTGPLPSGASGRSSGRLLVVISGTGRCFSVGSQADMIAAFGAASIPTSASGEWILERVSNFSSDSSIVVEEASWNNAGQTAFQSGHFDGDTFQYNGFLSGGIPAAPSGKFYRLRLSGRDNNAPDLEVYGEFAATGNGFRIHNADTMRRALGERAITSGGGTWRLERVNFVRAKAVMISGVFADNPQEHLEELQSLIAPVFAALSAPKTPKRSDITRALTTSVFAAFRNSFVAPPMKLLADDFEMMVEINRLSRLPSDSSDSANQIGRRFVVDATVAAGSGRADAERHIVWRANDPVDAAGFPLTPLASRPPQWTEIARWNSGSGSASMTAEYEGATNQYGFCFNNTPKSGSFSSSQLPQTNPYRLRLVGNSNLPSGASGVLIAQAPNRNYNSKGEQCYPFGTSAERTAAFGAARINSGGGEWILEAQTSAVLDIELERVGNTNTFRQKDNVNGSGKGTIRTPTKWRYHAQTFPTTNRNQDITLANLPAAIAAYGYLSQEAVLTAGNVIGKPKGRYAMLWNDIDGYPKTATKTQGRFAYGGTDAHPAVVWLSRVNQSDSFLDARPAYAIIGSAYSREDRAISVRADYSFDLELNAFAISAIVSDSSPLIIFTRDEAHIGRGVFNAVNPAEFITQRFGHYGQAENIGIASIDEQLFAFSYGAAYAFFYQSIEAGYIPQNISAARNEEIFRNDDGMPQRPVRVVAAQPADLDGAYLVFFLMPDGSMRVYHTLHRFEFAAWTKWTFFDGEEDERKIIDITAQGGEVRLLDNAGCVYALDASRFADDKGAENGGVEKVLPIPIVLELPSISDPRYQGDLLITPKDLHYAILYFKELSNQSDGKATAVHFIGNDTIDLSVQFDADPGGRVVIDPPPEDPTPLPECVSNVRRKCGRTTSPFFAFSNTDIEATVRIENRGVQPWELTRIDLEVGVVRGVAPDNAR